MQNVMKQYQQTSSHQRTEDYVPSSKDISSYQRTIYQDISAYQITNNIRSLITKCISIYFLRETNTGGGVTGSEPSLFAGKTPEAGLLALSGRFLCLIYSMYL